MFEDRRAAGRALAEAVCRSPLRPWHSPLVIALPRGGVPVGYEVALALGAPMDILCVRKLGAPGQPELAIGAVADGESPLSFINQEILRDLRVSPGYVAEERVRQMERLRALERSLREGRPPAPRKGRDVVLVDDGLATGATARVALERLKMDGVRGVVLAVAVGPSDTVEEIRTQTDGLLCLTIPSDFRCVGAYYRNFEAVSEEEVRCFLGGNRGLLINGAR